MALKPRYSDIQTLPDLICFVTLPGPYPAVKLALKYQPRPRIAQEFIPRVIDTDAEAHLSAVLAAREEEGRSIDGLFETDSQADAGVQPSQPTPVDSQPITVAPRHTPATTAAAAAVAAVQGGADTVATMGGGVERDLQELPASQEAAFPSGVDAQGEIVDPDAYTAWQAGQSSHALRDRQRKEEVNVNHSHVVSDEELGDGF